MQSDIVERLFVLARARASSRFSVTPEAALRELLRGRSGYEIDKPSGSNLAPFQHSKVSLPVDVNGAPRAFALAPAYLRRFLEGFEERIQRHDSDNF